jgi:hypothetical protein
MSIEAFVLRIAHRPDERNAGEMLEVVLAGASLELDLDVLFEGEGVAFLGDEAAGKWRQLLDHELAGIWYFGAVEISRGLQVAARPVDAAQRDHLIEGRTIIDL